MNTMNHSKRLTRSALSLALCLVLFVSLFAMPAFAANNTIVIIGETVKPGSSEPANSVVVSGGNNSGSTSSGSGASAGIAADTPVSGTQVVVGGQVANTQTAPTNAVVVQPDGTVVAVGQTQQAAQNTEAAAAATVPANTLTGLTAELFSLVNKTRSENGLSTLKYSAELQSIANLRAQESTVSFGHTRPDGSHCSTAVTVDWNVTGENLIQVTSSHATADLMMDTWMNSPTHKYNIMLDKFTDMAVGIWETNDTTFVTLIFVG